MKPAPQFYTSHLSRLCAEELPGDFHFLDGDEVLFRHSSLPIVYARETGILQIIESKLPGETIRRSQRETLPLLAGALKLANDAGLVAAGSGVYIVEGEPPWTAGAKVSRVRPAQRPMDWSAVGIQSDATHTLDGAALRTFIRCRRSRR